MSQKKTPQKNRTKKFTLPWLQKHRPLWLYLTNPLHHLRNLFQLLVDAVLEILGQVCDSLLVFSMRLVEKMLTSPLPQKRTTGRNPSQSRSGGKSWMDFLAAIVRRYLAWFFFWKFRKMVLEACKIIQICPSQGRSRPTKWLKLCRHDKVSCFWSSTSLISFLSFSVCNCLNQLIPKNPKLLNGCITLLCIWYQSSSAETNCPLFFPGAPECRWQPKTLSRCSMFSLASLATRFGDLLGVIFFWASRSSSQKASSTKGWRDRVPQWQERWSIMHFWRAPWRTNSSTSTFFTILCKPSS